MKFLDADCPYICVENPTPSTVYRLPPHSQTIQPYQFGHPYTKRTNLWLRGLPDLVPTDVVHPESTCRVAGNWFNAGGKERQANRSKTFPGIAKAMAEQWSAYVLDAD